MNTKRDVLVGSHRITLTDKDYKAQGGEGVVYVKNNAVYKIYHDPLKCIPEQKIVELQSLSHIDNMIIPNTSIIDANTKSRIGYVMRFVDDTEPICKLFVSNFKQDNNISPDMVQSLVKKMQETLFDIHKAGVVVGDYNEMNFLVDSSFKIPYHIDTDSYQTKSFKCQVIMDSVRDRKFKMGDFRQESDWFAWAIVSFQLYTGIHPFKGKHPNFKPNDFDGRMKAGVTVFDKDVSYPKFIDLSVIPQRHLDWYKDVFINGDRTPPPFADGIGNVQIIRNVVTNTTSHIDASLYFKYSDKIIFVSARAFNTWVITRDGVYRDKSQVFAFTNQMNHKAVLGFTDDDVPVIAVHLKKEKLVKFFDNKDVIGSCSAYDIMACNGCVYSISDVGLIEHTADKLGKVLVTHKMVAPVHPLATKLYEGIGIQDMFGKASVVIPYKKGYVSTIHVPELDGYKIFDAKRIGHVIMIIGEKKGVYDCITILLDKQTYNKYISTIDSDVDYRVVNFSVKSTGLIVKIEGDNDIKMFVDFNKAQVIQNTPVDIDFKIFGDGAINFINHDQIYVAKSR